MKMILILLCGLLFFSGCATLEISSPGSMKNDDRLLVIHNEGYTLLWFIPLCSGRLTWNARKQDVNLYPILFKDHATTPYLYDMAIKVADRENCDLEDVAFIDNYEGYDSSFLYGAFRSSDVAISAILRPRLKAEMDDSDESAADKKGGLSNE